LLFWRGEGGSSVRGVLSDLLLRIVKRKREEGGGIAGGEKNDLKRVKLFLRGSGDFHSRDRVKSLRQCRDFLPTSKRGHLPGKNMSGE